MDTTDLDFCSSTHSTAEQFVYIPPLMLESFMKIKRCSFYKKQAYKYIQSFREKWWKSTISGGLQCPLREPHMESWPQKFSSHICY